MDDSATWPAASQSLCPDEFREALAAQEAGRTLMWPRAVAARARDRGFPAWGCQPIPSARPLYRYVGRGGW